MGRPVLMVIRDRLQLLDCAEDQIAATVAAVIVDLPRHLRAAHVASVLAIVEGIE